MPGWVLMFAAYSALEYYLGKTDRVKQGSTIELLLHGAKVILGALSSRKGK